MRQGQRIHERRGTPVAGRIVVVLTHGPSAHRHVEVLTGGDLADDHFAIADLRKQRVGGDPAVTR